MTSSGLPGGVRGAPGSYANQPLVSPTRPGEEGGLDGVAGVPTLDTLGYTHEENRALLRSKSPAMRSKSPDPPDPVPAPGRSELQRSAQPGEVVRELEAKYSRKVNSALSKWKHRDGR